MCEPDIILHVEDDPDFALLLECALQQAGIIHRLIHFQGGEEAKAYLCGEGRFANRTQFPLPKVALVDLKMPRISGFELLEWIRNHSPCPRLPVVVLTSSDDIREVNRAYQLGANSFLLKPPTANDVKEVMGMVGRLWS